MIKSSPQNASKPAELFIYGPIGNEEDWGDVTPGAVTKCLSEIGKVPKVNVYINSVGGDVFHGIAIYNILRRFDARKVVMIDSVAASIASVIAMAGDEIVIAHNAQVMTHNPTAGGYGEEEDLMRVISLLQKAKSTIVDTYVSRTKQSRDKLEAWMKAETWFTAEDAVKNGFADRAVEMSPAINMASLDKEMQRSKLLTAKYRKQPSVIASPGNSASKARLDQMLMYKQKLQAGSPSSQRK